jgi:hypothetical protein
MRALCLLVALGCDGGMLIDGVGGGGGGGGNPDANASIDAPAENPDAANGLRADYFAGYMDLALSRIEPAIDHDWGNTAPDPAVGQTRFSVRWTADLVAPQTGSYQIVTDTDDGVRVFVGDQMVIDDWHGHFVTRNSAMVNLTAGMPVPLRVEYFQIDMAASAKMQITPAVDFFVPANPSGLAAPKPPYSNPVVGHDCPDPGVLALDGPRYVMVCTGGRFPLHISRNLVFWDDTTAAILPDGKPPWAANGGRNWAPEIHRVGAGYVAYFTSVNAQNVLSVGAASATDVMGPYQPTGGPLVEDPFGVIDPTFFEDDDGSRWLIYKIDGNSQGRPTPIRARQLSADGLSFAPGSTAHDLLVNDSSTWEGGVIEGPWLIKRNGTYYLFYSGNVYDYRYRTGVARASSLLGPYAKHGAPILANNDRFVGPGHGSVVPVGSADYFVYHAWLNAGDGTQQGAAGRQVFVDRIVWSNGWPAISDGTPSRTPQPWPAP